MTMLQRLIANPISVLYSLPAVLIGITVHEWAHAFVAYKMGDPTAKYMGRMSLNPFAHMDVFGFLCLVVIGFGWAKPVPINPSNFKNARRGELLVSLAGIVMNLITAFIVCVLYYFLCFFTKLGLNEAFRSIMAPIITINLSLAIFNLLPIYPLDGSHVFEILFMHKFPKACLFLRQYGRYILLAVLVFGLLNGFLSTVVNFILQLYFKAAIWLVSLFL